MIAFYCEVYNDTERGRRSVASLRAQYPDAPVTLVSDGSDRLSEWEDIAQAADCSLIQSTRMITPITGYDFLLRRVEVWRELKNVDHIICFDTDARFIRPFYNLPASDLPYVFGSTWTYSYGVIGINGGCYGLTSQAVRQILEVDITKLPALKTYDRPGYEEETIWLDYAAIGIYKQAKVKKRSHCEFGVHPKILRQGNFAVTHPHKDGNR